MLNRKRHSVTLSVILALLSSCGYSPSSGPMVVSVATPMLAPARAQTYDQLPLYFVENRGQADSRVNFYVPGQGQMLYFTPDGLTFAFTSGIIPNSQAPVSLAKPDDNRLAARRWAVKLDFIGADPSVRPLGENKTA